MVTKVLSIQSHVSYGYAGNSAAAFALQRVGVEVWPVLTVNFSNNSSYGSLRGPLISAADVAEVVKGIEEREVLGLADAVLSGYLGNLEVGQVILDSVSLVKKKNSAAIYCADPVMGDVGRGFYAKAGIPEFMRDHVVSVADIMTPNLFELEFLVGKQTKSTSDVIAAARQLLQTGPKIVLVTSVTGNDVPANTMRMLAVNAGGVWQIDTPLLDRSFTGSGDLTTAMFLAHLLEKGGLAASDLGYALEKTAAIVYSILEQTTREDSRELKLIAAQHNFEQPSFSFSASKIS